MWGSGVGGGWLDMEMRAALMNMGGINTVHGMSHQLAVIKRLM